MEPSDYGWGERVCKLSLPLLVVNLQHLVQGQEVMSYVVAMAVIRNPRQLANTKGI